MLRRYDRTIRAATVLCSPEDLFRVNPDPAPLPAQKWTETSVPSGAQS